MKMLYHYIGLKMVNYCGGCRDAQQVVGSSPEMRSELWSTVRGQTPRDTKQYDPRADEGFSICFCYRIFHGYGLRPKDESINDHLEIRFVLGFREGSNDIYVDAAKAHVRRVSLHKRSMYMALDLRGHAGMAFLAPAANITLESIPDNMIADISLLACIWDEKVHECF